MCLWTRRLLWRYFLWKHWLHLKLEFPIYIPLQRVSHIDERTSINPPRIWRDIWRPDSKQTRGGGYSLFFLSFQAKPETSGVLSLCVIFLTREALDDSLNVESWGALKCVWLWILCLLLLLEVFLLCPWWCFNYALSPLSL